MEKETLTRIVNKIVMRLEHAEYDRMTVTERQVTDVLKDAGIIYLAEDGTVRDGEIL
jgi:hypothetical protein